MADKFIPERFLEDSEIGTPHYGYGAGSRMCAGSHLANRELYTFYIRIITAFEMSPSDNPSDAPIMHCLDCSANSSSLTMDPKPFRINFKPRNPAQLDKWIAEAEGRTSHLR